MHTLNPRTSPTLADAFDWNAWQRPAADYSHCPFWFWNDDLDEAEIIRQIEDFKAHGVEAFVIHPRIGLPRSIGWLSDRLFHFMRVALEHARRLGMWVLLYDEGMYPSGSASGRVVARNPEFQVRGLVCRTAAEARQRQRPAHAQGADSSATTEIPAHAKRVTRADGETLFVFDKPVRAVVRGLHYITKDDDPEFLGEEEPLAADLLNPQAVQCFIELVYERFYKEFGDYFGNTVKGIFTDEPNPLSRLCEDGVVPGTRGTIEWVSRHLGYDFTPHLPALWFADKPDAAQKRRDYHRAINALMDESYYRPLSRWCQRHGIALTGHPADPDEIGHLRHLQIPGQDIVWRHILPGTPSALEGAPATMAKATASVKFHLGRARNLNEFAGAYGESLTFNELRWLASWLLIRGCDMLVPHACYYSLRGPRKFERPPNVGPHSPWWNNGYREWEALTRRLCWLNATYRPVCSVAILGSPTRLPWRAAKFCFEHQIDFHYIEPKDFENARVEQGRLRIGPGSYAVLIVEQDYLQEAATAPAGTPILHWREKAAEGASATPPDSHSCATELLQHAAPVVTLETAAPGLRARRLQLQGADTANMADILLLFNESESPIRTTAIIDGLRLNPYTGEIMQAINDDGLVLDLQPHEWATVLCSSPRLKPQ